MTATGNPHGALDATGHSTEYEPTLEDFRRYWMHRTFAGPSEKLEFEIGFYEWVNRWGVSE